ncbi:MAG: alpha/beta hydrolase [Novosphingobium sp.]
MSLFEDRYWTSKDGLRLHYRDYAGPADRPPVICLHGLTRNARDFDGVAARLAGKWRVICPDMRGRGDSDYSKDSATYGPLQYVEDLGELLSDQQIDRFVTIGTSMGGLMTLVMGWTMPERILGCLFNDIGPDLEMTGLERIKDYVGQGRNFPTWMHAARALEENQGDFFPDWQAGDWLAMAKRVMTLSSNGRIVYDYDMKIAQPFQDMDFTNQPDMWPAFDALADKPMVVVRGGLSDLFSAETMDKMLARGTDAEGVTIPRVGHAPTLDEPEVAAAIDRMLAKVG